MLGLWRSRRWRFSTAELSRRGWIPGGVSWWSRLRYRCRTATGLAIGALGAGYYGGYGYPYGGYGYGAYDVGYGGECFHPKRVVIDQFGYRHVRHVRVCY